MYTYFISEFDLGKTELPKSGLVVKKIFPEINLRYKTLAIPSPIKNISLMNG